MTLSRDAVEALRAQFSGTVLESNDAGYDVARAIHNGLIDKRPAAIANCFSTADIADAVRFGRPRRTVENHRTGASNAAPCRPGDSGFRLISYDCACFLLILDFALSPCRGRADAIPLHA